MFKSEIIKQIIKPLQAINLLEDVEMLETRLVDEGDLSKCYICGGSAYVCLTYTNHQRYFHRNLCQRCNGIPSADKKACLNLLDKFEKWQ